MRTSCYTLDQGVLESTALTGLGQGLIQEPRFTTGGGTTMNWAWECIEVWIYPVLDGF